MLPPCSFREERTPCAQRPCQADPAPLSRPAGSTQQHRAGACTHGAARAPKPDAQRSDPAPPPAAPEGPGPAHPSSAMALSVGAVPAWVPTANTDIGRPGERRRPPRGPRPARSRRDAPRAGGIPPGRAPAPSRTLTRHHRAPLHREGACSPPRAFIGPQDPGLRVRARRGCPRRCLIFGLHAPCPRGREICASLKPTAGKCETEIKGGN